MNRNMLSLNTSLVVIISFMINALITITLTSSNHISTSPVQSQLVNQRHRGQDTYHNQQQLLKTKQAPTQDSEKSRIPVKGLVILSDRGVEENEPFYKLHCPIEEIVTQRAEATNYTDAVIRKRFEFVKNNVRTTWLKNDEPWTTRENGNRFDKLDELTYVLYQVGASDDGKYTCLLNYSNIPANYSKYFDFHQGASFDLSLIFSLPDQSPTITHPPGHFYMRQGDSVQFTCNRTETLSTQRTEWFRSCPLKNITCLDNFMAAYNESLKERNTIPLTKFLIKTGYDEDVLNVDNITEAKTGYYGCAVSNLLGIDIRLGKLDLVENLLLSHMDSRVDSLRQLPANETIRWLWFSVSVAIFVIVSITSVGCIYIFKFSMKRDKKHEAPLISQHDGSSALGKNLNTRRRLPNIEAPDIYNTGKSVDGFITGHFHQPTGHLMAQSICSNLLDKVNPSISSSNSHQSDESSSAWGKSVSSSGDNCKAFYTHASHTTATTVPLYDHPPSTGTLRHCTTFVQDACVINPTYGFLRPENDAADWAFPRRNLDRLDRIGEGQFGEVWRYIARRKDGKGGDIVAVKQLKNCIGFGDRERQELIAEIEIMKSVNNHPNVIKLLHFCVDEFQPTLLIMEYAENGKLQAYLRKCRKPKKMYGCADSYLQSPSITSKELIKFTYHIAKGMEYVASKGIVHRDLASRNILVSKDKVCKVADFGFARRVNGECAYERTTTNLVPVKWMAPEALVENKFTSKSDVFSLGILMWEIVTLGATPYEQLTSEEVVQKVTTGSRLERPPHCRDEFYNLMDRCWRDDPKKRPTFKEVAYELEQLLLSENDYIELDQYPEHAYYNILYKAEKEVVHLET